MTGFPNLGFEAPTGKTPAVIVDLDGTLASSAWRVRKWLTEDDERWDEFFDDMVRDAIVPGVRALVKELSRTNAVIFVSGRDERWRYHTELWLGTHGIDGGHHGFSADITYEKLLMRPARSSQPDHELKLAAYRTLEPYYDVRLVIDDRPQVCDMWRELGLPLVQVVDPDLQPADPLEV